MLQLIIFVTQKGGKMQDPLKRIKFITVRCTAFQKKDLKRWAVKKDLSVSKFILKACQFYIGCLKIQDRKGKLNYLPSEYSEHLKAQHVKTDQNIGR